MNVLEAVGRFNACISSFVLNYLMIVHTVYVSFLPMNVSLPMSLVTLVGTLLTMCLKVHMFPVSSSRLCICVCVVFDSLDAQLFGCVLIAKGIWSLSLHFASCGESRCSVWYGVLCVVTAGAYSGSGGHILRVTP